MDNKDLKKRYRADVLIEEAIGKLEDKVNKEVEKRRQAFLENPLTRPCSFGNQSPGAGESKKLRRQ